MSKRHTSSNDFEQIDASKWQLSVNCTHSLHMLLYYYRSYDGHAVCCRKWDDVAQGVHFNNNIWKRSFHLIHSNIYCYTVLRPFVMHPRLSEWWFWPGLISDKVKCTSVTLISIVTMCKRRMEERKREKRMHGCGKETACAVPAMRIMSFTLTLLRRLNVVSLLFLRIHTQYALSPMPHAHTFT